MPMYKHLMSAVLLISVFAPVVRADLVADPNEFKQLKKLTGVDRQINSSGKSGNIAPKKEDAKKTSSEKTTAKVTDKATKTDGKDSEKTSGKSKVRSSTTASGKKSN